MNFIEFADKWIDENVSTFYSDMPTYVREFVALIARQRHSGASFRMFMGYIYKLIQDYRNQK